MEASGAKWIAVFVLGVGSFILGVIPIKISSALRWTRHGCQRSPRSQLIISLLLCFGAGVLLATALTHMLPEVREHIDEILQDPNTWPPIQDVPLTEILLSFGFFFVYGLDELVHAVLYRQQHPHQDDGALGQQSHGHGHSHCPPSELTAREPRPGGSNSLLRQSAGKHQYGATDCHGTHNTTKSDEESHLLSPSGHEHAAPLTATSGLLALLALSIHAVTEGLAIGLQGSGANVFFLLGAVATHKFVIAFCLGMELSSGTQVSLRFHTCYMIVFSGMSAVGILLGMVLMGSEPGGLAVQALQALAAGTLLYVTFCEVLPRERAKCHAGLAQFGAVLIGFLILLTLDTLVPHEEDLPNVSPVPIIDVTPFQEIGT